MPYLNVMTRIEDREDDELLYDLGGREHPAIFFLDAEGTILARHDMEDASAKALGETGARAARSLELRRKADAGDQVAKVDLAIAQCDLGVIELFDLEGQLASMMLTAEQERAVGVLRADSAVADMRIVLAKNRDQAANDLAAEEFFGLYRKGTHPARIANRRVYWSVLAEHAVAKKDAPMLKDAIAGLKETFDAVPSPRALGRIAELEKHLRALEEAK